MSPQLSPQINDIKQPLPAAAPDKSIGDPQVKTEVVEDIPVEVQGVVPLTTNPITNRVIATKQEQPPGDQEFDQILKDVNRAVKKQPSETSDKQSHRGFKKIKQQAGPQVAKPRSGQALPIALALAVAIALVFAAFMAFRKTGGA